MGLVAQAAPKATTTRVPPAGDASTRTVAACSRACCAPEASPSPLPRPAAGARPVRGRLEPPERLEDAVAIALRDAVAVVVDGQHGCRSAGQCDPDVPAGAAMVGGVGHEVRDEQPQARLPAR